MPKVAREQIAITRVLKGILDSYPAGAAILRELIQNTDDCKATVQNFILDTRSFSTEHLVDPVLATCQGPALIATNNGVFHTADWEAITTINTSSKDKDETSTGKFGLGFRSCYHITDTPQILSGDKFRILDPHQNMKGFPGGVDIMTGSDDRELYSSHFDTFAAILPNLHTENRYNGTAIRLPLRLESQAQKSQIKDTATSITEIRSMFKDYVTKELAETMLFLKHVASIQLSEIGSDDVQRTIARAWIEKADVLSPHRGRNRGREQETSFLELTVHVEAGGVTTSRRWLVWHFVEDRGLVITTMVDRLGRPRNDVMKMLDADKLLPHVALAVPVPLHGLPSDSSMAPLAGRLFTLLPLPIVTGFPLHLHGVFALTTSRQNLRNSHDVARGSRQEFLVEWNRTIFEDLAPKAWAGLLKHLSKLPYGIGPYDFWPSTHTSIGGDQVYWEALPGRLLEFAAPLPVWPVSGGNREVVHFLSLEKLLVAPPEFDQGIIEALKLCEVPVTCPPQAIYSVIAEEMPSVVISPARVSDSLKGHGRVLLGHLDKLNIRRICDYIASCRDLNLLLGIPLLPTVGGRHISITLREKHKFSLTTRDEAYLFREMDENSLSLEDMAPTTVNLLRTGGVQYLPPNIVLAYLKRKFGKFHASTGTISTSVTKEDKHWLTKFWSWFGEWNLESEFHTDKALSTEIRKLYLLPLSVGVALRRCSNFAIDPSGAERKLLRVIEKLQLPVLHDSVPSRGKIIQTMLRPVDDISFLLQELSARLAKFSKLGQQHSSVLHSYFTKALSNQCETLTKAQIKTFRLLPIFPIIPAGERKSKRYEFGAAPNLARFIDESVSIIPNIPGTPFIDAVVGRILMEALEIEVTPEKIVLEMAINNWTHQNSDVALHLVERVMKRINDLSPEARNVLCNLPIVDVGLDKLRTPASVVDPRTPLASLYDPEEGIIPSGLYALTGPGSYLQQLRNCNMLQTTLSPAAIMERIESIANPFKPLQNRERKALRLLQLIDDSFEESKDSGVVKVITKHRWLPASGHYHLASECWDRHPSDLPLCDLVLPIVQAEVASSLRTVLGWDRVSIDTIKQQFLKVLAARSSQTKGKKSNDTRPIIEILRELASRYNDKSCSDLDLQELLETIGDQAWVPITGKQLHVAEYTTIHAANLGPDFRQVHSDLLDDYITPLLEQMGVLERPSLDALRSKLFAISHEPHPNVNVALKILEEIVSRVTDLDLNDTLVPTTQGLRPAKNVIYDDIGLGSVMPDGFHVAHPSIAPALAKELNLIHLSDEHFSRDESEFDTFMISEDLSTRIKGVLKDYDIDYVCNEWVANADDAGADEVSLYVDERVFNTSGLLAPSLSEFQNCPALVIHNNAVFSDTDFEGLSKIGLGGKGDASDKIGRFGLGALSFYHFTESPMVVSANYVLFLDPSRQYLPGVSKKSRKRPTGIKLSLDFCRIKYPGHLMALDGLSGFASDKSYYHGTLFRLPLRTVAQAKTSKVSDKSFSTLDIHQIITKFYHLATKSLFFSRIKSISALRRLTDGQISRMWRVQGVRSDKGKGKMFKELTLELHAESGNSPVKEQWLIVAAAENLPSQFEELVARHRLPPLLSISMALLLSSRPSDASQLFATLPLPIATSLPVHLHAPWVLSSDRRSVHYVAADANGERPLESVYNHYLLEKLIPPLYFSSLASMTSNDADQVYDYWPTKTTDPISRSVVEGFYKHFAATDECVCYTATKEWIAPKDAIFHTAKCSGVRLLLADLHIPEFVWNLPHFDRSLVAWEGLRTDSAKELADLLRHYSTDVLKGLGAKEGSDDLLKASEFSSILEYLIEGEQDLVGIPLLQLGNKKVVPFRSSEDAPVFASNLLDIGNLFGKKCVVGPAIAGDQSVIDHLVQANVNVQKLEEGGIRQLLAKSQAKVVPGSIEEVQKAVEWYKGVLKFLDRLDSLEWADVDDLPLIPTIDKNVISLRHIQKRQVLRESVLSRSDCPTVALIELGLTIIDDSDLPSSLLPHGNAHLAILRAIRSTKGVLRRLTRPVSVTQWDKLAEWLEQNFISQELENDDVNTLKRLPLFVGYGGAEEGSPLWAAEDLEMVPDTLTPTDLDLIKKYLPPETAFTLWSSTVETIFRRCQRTAHELTPDAFLALLRIPSTLPESDDNQYCRVLELFVRWHSKPFRGPLIPDENRDIKSPGDLYDHRIQVFRNAFQGHLNLFVHRNFRQSDRFTDGLVTLGLRNKITSEELMVCVSTLHEDAENGVPTAERARQFWHYFNSNDAPAAIQRIDFNQISDRRFIPCDPERHSHFGGYAAVLPSVVSPNQVALDEQLPVVWTQRAPFGQNPSRFVTTIMPSFGQPDAVEVVEHLVVLATEIAADHPSDRRLLDDIKATYKWLNDDLDKARPCLESKSHLPIWLNVQNPESNSESWTWRTAEQLVFDMSFDGENGRYDVKAFLSSFRPLLLAAGAKAFVHAQIIEPPALDSQSTHLERLRQGWSRLRENQHFFDIQFNVEGEVIMAHRGMLAAVVEHFMTALTGEYLEKTVTSSSDDCIVYPLHAEVSAFAVHSVVDYVYTGSLPEPACNNVEEAGPVLAGLLDLLDLANMWEIPELQYQTENMIVQLKLIRVETWDTIHERALASQATRLVDLCLETKQANAWASCN